MWQTHGTKKWHVTTPYGQDSCTVRTCVHTQQALMSDDRAVHDNTYNTHTN